MMADLEQNFQKSAHRGSSKLRAYHTSSYEDVRTVMDLQQ